MDIDLEKIAADWPSPFVARTEIQKFTNGAYKTSTLNSLDGHKEGIERKIYLGTKVAYLKEDVIEWIKNRNVNKKKEDQNG